jgi:hypothetical protein
MATKKTVPRKTEAAAIRDSAAKSRKKAKRTAAAGETFQENIGEDSTSISIHEKVALLAYRYWEERGRHGGNPEEDWFRAEREVLARVSNNK